MGFNWQERLKYGAIGLGLLGLIVLYALEFNWFNRTINMPALALGSFILALLIGLGIGHRYAQQEHGLTEKIQIYLFFAGSCGIFGPLAGSLSNRLLSPPAGSPTPVEFVDQWSEYASRGGLMKGEVPQGNLYTIEFYYRQRVRRVISRTPVPNPGARGDTIYLLIKPGLWGFEVVQNKAAAE